MTAPYRPPAPEDYWGNANRSLDTVTSEIDNYFKTYQQISDSMVQQVMTTRQLAKQGFQNPQELAQGAVAREYMNPKAQIDLDKLYGAAQFYEIPNYEKMPVQELQSVIAQRRNDMKDNPAFNTGNPWLDTLQSFGTSMVGATLGTVGGALDWASQAPLIGKFIRNRDFTHNMRQQIAQVNEGLESDLTDWDRKAYDFSYGTVGPMIGLAVPAAGAWKVAGALGRIGPVAAIGSRIGAIGRVGSVINIGIQSAATDVLLKAGEEKSMHDRAEEAMYAGLLGGGIGAVMVYGGPVADAFKSASSRVYSKVRGSFITPADQLNPAMEIFPRSSGAIDVLPSATSPAALQSGGAPRLLGAGDAPRSYQVPVLEGQPPRPALPATIPGEPIPMGPLGSTGLVPESMRLGPGPLMNPAYRPINPVETDLFDHYTNMAAGLEATNPEAAASLRQIAQEFAPAPQNPVIMPPGRTYLDEWDVAMLDQQKAALGQPVPERAAFGGATSLQQAVDETMGAFASVKGGKGGGYSAAMTPAQAATTGQNLTKQVTIMESPAMLEMAKQPRYDDFDVAVAAGASNPGSINVVQGLGDQSKTIRQLVQAEVEGRLMPQTFRVVPIETTDATGQTVLRNDLLVSDGLPITNKRVQQYKDTGTFEGMRVTLKGGSEVTLVTPGTVGGFATVKSPSGLEFYVPHEDILPGKTTHVEPKDVGIVDAPALYNEMRNTVIRNNELESVSTGQPLYNWLDPETSLTLSGDVEGFLDSKGITNPIQRSAIRSYFDLERTKDFQMTSPQDLAHMRSLNAIASSELISSRAMAKLEPTLDDVASAKGFRWEPTPNEPGGELVDIWTQERFPVDNEQGATDLLTKFNREVPDLNPQTDVPIETMETPPGGEHPGVTTQPNPGPDDYIQQADYSVDEIEEAIADMEEGLSNPRFLVDATGAATDIDAVMASRAREANPLSGLPAVRPPNAAGFIESFGGGGGGSGRPPVPPPFGSAPEPQPQGSVLGEQFARAKRQRPADMADALRQLDGLWLRYGTPFRRLTLKLENSFAKLGITESHLWSDYNALTTDVVKAQNNAQPWHSEFKDIYSRFPRKLLRDGTVMRIEEIGDYNQKIEAMKAAGYTDEMMAAQRRIRDVFDRGFEAFGLKPSNYLFNYMPMVRKFQGMPGIADPYGAALNTLPKELQFFGDYMRQHGVNFRNLNAETVSHLWVRAVSFERSAGASWAKMVQRWDDPRIPDEMKNMVADWLNTVRLGVNPGYSPAIQGARQMLNNFGVPVTDADLRMLWNKTFTSIYRSKLGLRPDVFFRDSIQPLFTGTKVGFKPVAEAYTNFFRDKQLRADMWKRGVEGGWVEKGAMQLTGSEMFEGAYMTPEGQHAFSPEMAARRELMSKFADGLRDMMPQKMRGGITGTYADPLFAYQHLQDFNRLIAGESGYIEANRAINQFRAGELPTMDALMVESKASAYPKPIRDQFRQFMEAGNDDAARNLLANEAANLQFRFGARENPIGVSGFGGRLVNMFGNFPRQYLAFMQEGLANGTVSQRAGFAMRNAAITGALGLAGASTGWKFGSWMWHKSLAWGGGPLLDPIVDAARGATAVTQGLFGQQSSQEQKDALRDILSPSQSFDQTMLGSVFPYTGGLKTAANLEAAAMGGNPGETFMRTLFTGEAGRGPEFRQMFQNGPYGLPQSPSTVPTVTKAGNGGYVPPPTIPQPGGGAQ